MKGYRNNQEATKNSITGDGWFRSGDLGSIDVDGSVTIADRLKELIKVKHIFDFFLQFWNLSSQVTKSTL